MKRNQHFVTKRNHNISPGLFASVIRLLIVLVMFFYSCQEPLKLNHIQVLGSHNSYKLPIEAPLMQMLMKQDADRFMGLDYGHIPIKDQLNLGLRKLELDIYHDPKGNKYAEPYGHFILQSSGIPVEKFDSSGLMSRPGFKVFHVQDIDFRSSCLLLGDCLREILGWSIQNAGHLPIVISFNVKTEEFNEEPNFTVPLPFTSGVFDSLDNTLLSYIPRSKIIIPDDVRGDYPTLKDAVRNDNWPTLEESKNKFIFVLDEPPEKQAPYIQDHPSLKGRVMFVNSSYDQPEAAILIINDPIQHHDLIQSMVVEGFLVRTRADANTLEARNGDYSRFEAALSSGAHFISTDYYLPDQKFGHEFHISIPGDGIFRKNPVRSNHHR